MHKEPSLLDGFRFFFDLCTKAILVYNYASYVYVDDEFIGEYTLAKSKDLRGKFGYGVISGTNRDYGTHCEISNARMWEITK